MKFNPKKVGQSGESPLEKRRPNWLKISIGANIGVVIIAVLFVAGSYVVNLSNTSPSFCGVCHIMQTNVTSYLKSSNLDHVHQEAGVQCKDCHDYPLTAEIKSGVNFMTGNYIVDKTGNLKPVKFSDAMCTKCHISLEHVATQTDFLVKNPHNSHNGELPCSTCHVSHGAQIDYCATCHDNGGQRLIGQPIQSRGTLGGS